MTAAYAVSNKGITNTYFFHFLLISLNYPKNSNIYNRNEKIPKKLFVF